MVRIPQEEKGVSYVNIFLGVEESGMCIIISRYCKLPCLQRTA